MFTPKWLTHIQTMYCTSALTDATPGRQGRRTVHTLSPWLHLHSQCSCFSVQQQTAEGSFPLLLFLSLLLFLLFLLILCHGGENHEYPSITHVPLSPEIPPQNKPFAFFMFTCFHPGKLSNTSFVMSNVFWRLTERKSKFSRQKKHNLNILQELFRAQKCKMWTVNVINMDEIKLRQRISARIRRNGGSEWPEVQMDLRFSRTWV